MPCSNGEKVSSLGDCMYALICNQNDGARIIVHVLVFTSVGTTRGQGIIRVVVVVVAAAIFF